MTNNNKKSLEKTFRRTFIPERLKQLREDAGLSRTEFGKLMGYEGKIAYNMAWRYESGNVMPVVGIIVQIAEALKVPIDAIAPRVGEPPMEVKLTARTGQAKPKREWHPSWTFSDK